MSGELIADKALILRNFTVKESDCVLHCLTEHHGKIHLYAKHARNSKRRFGGGLDPLSLGEIEFKQPSERKSSSSLAFIESFRTIDSAHRYLTPFHLYQSASLWVECLDYLSTEGDSQSDLFSMARATLAELTVLSSKEDFEQTLSRAIRNILLKTGFLAEEQPVRNFAHALTLVEEVAQRALKAKW